MELFGTEIIQPPRAVAYNSSITDVVLRVLRRDEREACDWATLHKGCHAVNELVVSLTLVGNSIFFILCSKGIVLLRSDFVT